MKSKNEIQKRSPKLHVKCHREASSGEAIYLHRLGQPVQGSYHLDALQLLRSIHSCLLHTRLMGVSESHLRKVKIWLFCTKL
jgi:hypothetical protein